MKDYGAVNRISRPILRVYNIFTRISRPVKRVYYNVARISRHNTSNRMYTVVVRTRRPVEGYISML